MEHRILAIVVTDLQGFTEAAGRAEREDVEAFIARHHAEVGSVIREHGGRLVKTLGDGTLSVFETITDAVRAADALRRRCDLSLPGVGTLPIRVAIHVGEVGVDAEGDVHGDAVNLVFRLADGVRGGAVCLTEAAYHVGHWENETVSRVGAFVFKGIPQPVTVYALSSLTGDTEPPMQASQDVRPFYRPSPWWRRLISFYMDVLIFSTSFGLLVGWILRPWFVHWHPPAVTRGDVSAESTSTSPFVQMETPLGKVEAQGSHVTVETPIGRVRAEPGTVVVESPYRTLLRINYLRLSGLEVLVFVLYLSLSWTLGRGRTPGNWLTQTAVVDVDTGLPPSFFRALIRAVLLVLLVLPVGLGLIIPFLWGRQLPHDRWTQTVVVLQR
ncbi:MAG: RDD family protein [Acidobacteria bacterium]|nr:RDD family protein [Acidobacteriota bacterium]MDW7984076.1 RDD family protein [Acidobacteriota bacterium]